MPALFMDLLEKLSDAINRASKVLLAVVMTAMVFSTGLQVACRYINNSALSWPEEVNVFFMAWITFVGSSVALKQSGHIGIDLFVNKFPGRLRRFVVIAGHISMFVFIILLVRTGYNVAMMNMNVISDALEIPMFYPRMSLVVGGLLMLCQMLYILCKDIDAFFQNKDGES